jgi:hypothetical protein
MSMVYRSDTCMGRLSDFVENPAAQAKGIGLVFWYEQLAPAENEKAPLQVKPFHDGIKPNWC